MINPVVTDICDEPEGTVERRVYPLILDIDNLRIFYEKASQHRTLFYEDIKGDFKKFCEVFLSVNPNDMSDVTSNGLIWVVDDFVGVYYITDIRALRDATVHYSFFDGRHRGRVGLTKKMIKYVFDTYHFRRLNVEVAAYAGKYVSPFIDQLGFLYEGKRRKAIKLDGKWFDLLLFGLLKEEFENGTEN